MREVIVSVKPAYSRSIVLGTKTVELRRRPTRLAAGDRLWIYSSGCDKCLLGVADVVSVELDKPSAIWRRWARQTALSKRVFEEYAQGASHISAIQISGLNELIRPVPLNEIRQAVPGFHPPQFLKYVTPDDVLFEFLMRLETCSRAA